MNSNEVIFKPCTEVQNFYYDQLIGNVSCGNIKMNCNDIFDKPCVEAQSISFQSLTSSLNLRNMNSSNDNIDNCTEVQRTFSCLSLNASDRSLNVISDDLTAAPSNLNMEKSNINYENASDDCMPSSRHVSKLGPAFSDFMVPRKKLVKLGTILWLDSFNVIEYRMLDEMFDYYRTLMITEGVVPWDGEDVQALTPVIARHLLPVVDTRFAASGMMIFKWHDMYVTLGTHFDQMRAYVLGLTPCLCELPFGGYSGLYSAYVLPCISGMYGLNQEVTRKLLQTVDDICDRRWTMLQVKRKLGRTYHTIARALPAEEVPGWISPVWDEISEACDPQYKCGVCGKRGIVTCCARTYLTPRQARRERITRQTRPAEEAPIKLVAKGKLAKLDKAKTRDITAEMGFVYAGASDHHKARYINGKVIKMGSMYNPIFSHVKAHKEYEQYRLSAKDKVDDSEIFTRFKFALSSPIINKSKQPVRSVQRKEREYKRPRIVRKHIVAEKPFSDFDAITDLFKVEAQGMHVIDFFDNGSVISPDYIEVLNADISEDVWFNKTIDSVKECVKEYKQNKRNIDDVDVIEFELLDAQLDRLARRWTLKDTGVINNTVLGDWHLGDRKAFFSPALNFPSVDWRILERYIDTGRLAGKLDHNITAYAYHITGDNDIIDAMRDQLLTGYGMRNKPRNLYDVCVHSVIPMTKFYEKHGWPCNMRNRKAKAQGLFSLPDFSGAAEAVTRASNSVTSVATTLSQWLSGLGEYSLENVFDGIRESLSVIPIGLKVLNIVRSGLTWDNLMSLLFEIMCAVGNGIKISFIRLREAELKRKLKTSTNAHICTILETVRREHPALDGKIVLYGRKGWDRVALVCDYNEVENLLIARKPCFDMVEGHRYFGVDTIFPTALTFNGEQYLVRYGLDALALPRVVAQSGDFDFMSTIFGLMANLNKCLPALRNFNTIVSAWRSGKQVLRSYVDLLPQCVLEFFGIVSDVFVTTDEMFQKDLETYAELSRTYTCNPFNITKYDQENLDALYTRMQDYQRRASLSINKGTVSHYLSMAVREMRTITACRRDVEQLTFNRYNPYAILLSGAPGVGKSEVAKRLATYFLEFAKDPELTANERFSKMAQPGMYCYQSQLDYMDGYAKEGVMIIDELGQRTDGEDLINMFSMISSNRFVCPMASMDDAVIGKKGTTFTSHTVIACSNIESFSSMTNAFHKPEAINRRFLMKLSVSSVGEKCPDFSNLRFQIDSQGELYTIKQISYILKNHPTRGFVRFFRSQFTLNHQATEMEEVDMSRIRFAQPPTNAVRVMAQGFVSTADKISRAFILMAGLFNTYVGYVTFNVANEHSIGKMVMGACSIVTGIISMLYAIVPEVVDSQCREAASLQALIRELKEELNSETRAVRDHIQEYVAESGHGGGKKASTKGKVQSKYASRARIVVHGDNDDVERVRRIVQAYIDEGELSEQEIVFLRNMLKELAPREISQRIEARAFKDRQQTVVVDPNSNIRLEIKSQGVGDENAYAIENKCAKALCWVTLYNDVGTPVTSMNAIPLTGVFFLVPYHFVSRAKADWSVEITWVFGDRKHRERFDEMRCKRLGEETDAVVLAFSRLPWRPPALAKCFVREEEVKYLKECPVSVITRKRELDEIGIYSTIGECLTTPIEYEDWDDVYTLVHGFHYQINTRRGDCGAPVLVHDKSVPHKIIGMHVAGMEGVAYGLANLITYEQLEDFVTAATYETKDTCVAMGTIDLIGEIQHGSSPFQSRRTGFYRTHVDVLPTPKNPVDLRVRDGNDPVLNAIMKNARERPTKQMAPERMEHIANHIAKRFPKDRCTDVLSDYDTINGTVLAPINLKSSMGYPYVLDQTKKKKVIFNRELNGDTTIVDYAFKRDWERLERQLEIGPPDIYWVSCGKDECLKPGKAPRIFEIPPFHYTLSMRKHFGSFISWIHSNPFKAYSAIGMNAESAQWNKIYTDLLLKSDLGLDFDWKRFDSTIPVFLFRATKLLADKWYGNVSVQRDNLLRALEVRPTFFENYLFIIRGGNPSGNVLTTLLNTFAQIFLLMDAWLNSVPADIRSLYHFDLYVCVYLYGDDGIMSVHARARRYYNFAVIRDHVAQYMMEITTASKDATESGFQPIAALTFLKRGFRRDDRGMMVPILAWDSLYTMLNYNYENKQVTRRETFRVVSLNFCAFLYFYGEDVYNEMVAMLELKCPEWDYWDNRFYGSGEEYIAFQTF